MNMTTRPIPVPPPGTQLEWRLDAPCSSRHVLMIIALLALLLWSGHRTEMDRMLDMSAQAVGKAIGLADDSQVLHGLSRVGSSLWPPAVAEQEEVARIAGFDRNNLPPFARIEVQELISALFLVLAYGFGPIAGVLALGLHAAGFLGKFYAEDIENADKKPQEALEAIGAGKLKTLWYGVLPQVLPQYIDYTLYVLDRNVRMATVIGLVGAGGNGQELKGRFDMFHYGHVATILIAIFIVVFLLDQFSSRLGARLM
jgi:hypothetical protein